MSKKVAMIWSGSTRYGFYAPADDRFYEYISELNPWWVRGCAIEEHPESELKEQLWQKKMNGIRMYKFSYAKSGRA